MIRCHRRTARKPHRCDCGKSIEPGDHYVEVVASPHHDDLGNPHWWRLVECDECAQRYGRVALSVLGVMTTQPAVAAEFLREDTTKEGQR